MTQGQNITTKRPPKGSMVYYLHESGQIGSFRYDETFMWEISMADRGMLYTDEWALKKDLYRAFLQWKTGATECKP